MVLWARIRKEPFDLDGNLWVVEHGARGGDEVNAVRKGANYGWPVIAYGGTIQAAKLVKAPKKTAWISQLFLGSVDGPIWHDDLFRRALA